MVVFWALSSENFWVHGCTINPKCIQCRHRQRCCYCASDMLVLLHGKWTQEVTSICLVASLSLGHKAAKSDSVSESHEESLLHGSCRSWKVSNSIRGLIGFENVFRLFYKRLKYDVIQCFCIWLQTETLYTYTKSGFAVPVDCSLRRLVNPFLWSFSHHHQTCSKNFYFYQLQ